MGRTGKITIDVARLDQLIEAKLQERLADLGLGDKLHSTGLATDDWQAGVDQLKGKSVPFAPYRLVACQSKSGARFLARVVMSRDAKRFPEGRVVALDEYQFPEGTEVHETQGGLVPDGLQIRHPNTDKLTTEYKQWRWENFWQRDLRAFVGQPLDLRDRLDPDLPMERWITPSEPENDDEDASEADAA